MEAIISDITGKNIPKKLSYKVSVTSRSNNTILDFDGTKEDLENNKIWDAVKLALQNGNEWYQLRMVNGKWIHLEIPKEVEPKND